MILNYWIYPKFYEEKKLFETSSHFQKNLFKEHKQSYKKYLKHCKLTKTEYEQAIFMAWLIEKFYMNINSINDKFFQDFIREYKRNLKFFHRKILFFEILFYIIIVIVLLIIVKYYY